MEQGVFGFAEMKIKNGFEIVGGEVDLYTVGWGRG